MGVNQEEIKDKVKESGKELEDELKIEVEDDTPETDRGRAPLPKDIVEELEKDELEEYSDKVKRRLSQMKKVWHDERRAKEAADREREAAIQYAHQIRQENENLKKKIGAGEKLFIEEVSKAATLSIASAKEALRQAYESGDSQKIADAQEALTDAKLKLNQYQTYKPSLQEEEKGVEVPQQTQTPRVVADPRAESWRKQNTWFGADEEMTALALGLHEKLVRSGVDPRSDNYYESIDKTMRKRFPEYFEEEPEKTHGKEEEKPPVTSRRAATNVAPATRSTAPKQIKLTASQVAIAKKLGITPEQYAREMLKVENANG